MVAVLERECLHFFETELRKFMRTQCNRFAPEIRRWGAELARCLALASGASVHPL